MDMAGKEGMMDRWVWAMAVFLREERSEWSQYAQWMGGGGLGGNEYAKILFL